MAEFVHYPYLRLSWPTRRGGVREQAVAIRHFDLRQGLFVEFRLFVYDSIHKKDKESTRQLDALD